jgi:hypothetical protein
MLYADAETLGPRQSLLASGALLARDVPIARTGQQTYSVFELPGFEDAADADGWIAVQRDEGQVFDPLSMASFEGVPVVMRHPEAAAIGPDNWRTLAVGHAQNVRRSGDMLIADLLIHDRAAIDAIRNGGWRSISCGYDASYMAARDGGLRQSDIRGNHIAILHPSDQARCGPTCSIGDAAYTGRDTMRHRARDNAAEPYREGSETMGARGGSPTGPTVVARVAYPAPSCSIGQGSDGNALVWFHGPVSKGMDPGQGNVTTDAAMRREVNARVERQQQAARDMAANIKAFWEAQRHA